MFLVPFCKSPIKMSLNFNYTPLTKKYQANLLEQAIQKPFLIKDLTKNNCCKKGNDYSTYLACKNILPKPYGIWT